MQILTFKAPNRPLSINESNRMHWAQRSRRLKPWRQIAEVEARNSYKQPKTPVPIHVKISLPFDRKARRDGHNYGSTNAKSVIDGLVAAGIVPDDTPDWVTLADPVLQVCPEGWVHIEITEVRNEEAL